MGKILNFPLGARGLPCALHKYHYPPARTHDHHPWPKYMGGPEKQDLVPCCPTGHDNVHLYLDWMLSKLQFMHPHLFENHPPRFMVTDAAPRVTRSEKALAIRGYRAWADAGRPALLPKEKTA